MTNEVSTVVNPPPKIIDVESRVIEPEKPRGNRGAALGREFASAFTHRNRGKSGGDPGNDSHSGRPSLNANSVWFMLALEFVVLIACRIFFGLQFAIVLQFALLAFVAARNYGPHMGLMAGNLGFGLIAVREWFGYIPLWPSSLIGAICVLLIAFDFLNTASPTTGDVNPITYIIAIIAVRAYLATFYASITAVNTSDNILNWLTTFVIGVVPDWPTIANVASFMVLNGTLLVYLVLLLKRIANPLAN